MKKSWKRNLLLTVAGTAALTTDYGAAGADSQVIQVDMVQYKMETVDIFEELEEKFNTTHNDIRLNIDSPNDTVTTLKTHFIREDAPDIIGIGGEISYSSSLDSGMLMNLNDYEGLPTINESYLKVDKELESVPKDGVYAVSHVANAAGILYSKDLFEEHGWAAPATWGGFTTLCRQIQGEGALPMFFGFKDTWDYLVPWNAISADLAPPDVYSLVNRGKATFTEQYRKMAERTLTLLEFAREDPFSYGYNGACTAFVRGESAMFVIGSYTIPQIRSVNPDINIDTFVFPTSNQAEENILNFGIDLQFCVMADSPSKEAAYEVLDFLLQDENVQLYLDDQSAMPYRNGDFTLPGALDGVAPYIREGKTVDYQGHHYSTEMPTDAMIQTYLVDGNTDVFLERFDREWQRYSQGLIIKVQNYEREQERKVSGGGEEND